MNKSVMAGDSARLQCRVLAVLGSELRWEAERALGDSIQVITTVGSETKALLVFQKIALSKAGWYRCVALVPDPGTGILRRFPSSVAYLTVVDMSLATLSKHIRYTGL